MTATKAKCCYVQIRARGNDIDCVTEPEWGFTDGPATSVNYACADHLGHVLSDEHGISVWPLTDGGYDPTLYSPEDIVAAKAAE